MHCVAHRRMHALMHAHRRVHALCEPLVLAAGSPGRNGSSSAVTVTSCRRSVSSPTAAIGSRLVASTARKVQLCSSACEKLSEYSAPQIVSLTLSK